MPSSGYLLCTPSTLKHGASKRLFNEVWMPNVWNRCPGREGSLNGFRQPDTLLVWNNYTVHTVVVYKEAVTKYNTTLFLLPGGLGPKIQPFEMSKAIQIEDNGTLRSVHGFPRHRATTLVTGVPVQAAAGAVREESVGQD